MTGFTEWRSQLHMRVKLTELIDKRFAPHHTQPSYRAYTHNKVTRILPTPSATGLARFARRVPPSVPLAARPSPNRLARAHAQPTKPTDASLQTRIFTMRASRVFWRDVGIVAIGLLRSVTSPPITITEATFAVRARHGQVGFEDPTVATGRAVPSRVRLASLSTPTGIR